tara:strand:- start:6758 stop:7129 length:372 start_codon:yes stop_codon:yes gene_type:complete
MLCGFSAMKLIENIAYRFYSTGKLLSLNIYPDSFTSFIIATPITILLTLAFKKTNSGISGNFEIPFFVILFIGSLIYLNYKIKNDSFKTIEESESKRARVIGHIIIISYLVFSFLLLLMLLTW